MVESMSELAELAGWRSWLAEEAKKEAAKKYSEGNTVKEEKLAPKD